MDLVELSKNLSRKVDMFANRSTLSSIQEFKLREEIRAEANRVIYAIDGPEQALKSITRGVGIHYSIRVPSRLRKKLVHMLYRAENMCRPGSGPGPV